MTGSIETCSEDRICTITLENDGKRNAIDYAMMERLTEVFMDLDQADSDAIVILRGAGDLAFSAGFDLSAERREDFEAWDRMIEAIVDHDYPTIAMLNGLAYGGGVHVAVAADLRIARRNVRMAIPEARLGIVYAPDAIDRLVRLIGPATTKELLYSGAPIRADRARSIGLLNHVVEAESLDEFTYDLADQIGGNAPFSIRSMKWIADSLTTKGLDDSEVGERAQSLRHEAFETADYREGTRAFAEDREPEFHGC